MDTLDQILNVLQTLHNNAEQPDDKAALIAIGEMFMALVESEQRLASELDTVEAQRNNAWEDGFLDGMAAAENYTQALEERHDEQVTLIAELHERLEHAEDEYAALADAVNWYENAKRGAA